MIEEDTYETTDGPFVEKYETFTSEKDTYHTELVNPHELTPLTPAVQFSKYYLFFLPTLIAFCGVPFLYSTLLYNDSCGKEASTAWFPSGKYLQSPESSFTYPYTTSQNSDANVVISETSTENIDLVSVDQESHHGNADTVAQFSEAGKMGPFGNSLSAKRNHSSGTWLVWRGSPITPMAEFSGSKEAAFDLDVSEIVVDDTPEIVTDTCTPVKVSSPNKKRVSPRRPYERGSSSSAAGIRSGRKYILKAVPSFPPLTPCIRFNASDVQPQDNRTANK